MEIHAKIRFENSSLLERSSVSFRQLKDVSNGRTIFIF